jgi:hypothetical protein
MNLYVYVENDPLNAADLLGFSADNYQLGQRWWPSSVGLNQISSPDAQAGISVGDWLTVGPGQTMAQPTDPVTAQNQRAALAMNLPGLGPTYLDAQFGPMVAAFQRNAQASGVML